MLARASRHLFACKRAWSHYL